MTLETPATLNDKDLDRDARFDRLRTVILVLVVLLIVAISWILVTQNETAKDQAASASAQKFTLAQQVAAACAVKEQADDLGGLCANAKAIVKEGPAGPPGEPGETIVGPTGPFGAKGERGPQGVQGPTGLQGVFGVDGVTGLTGPAGVEGANGLNGSDGANGLNGSDGANGPNGTDGAPGSPGATGATGATGPAPFPFNFTFATTDGTFDCTITAQDAIALCAMQVP